MSTIIYVTSLDGEQVEPLNSISDDFKMEQSIDGTFTVSFTCFIDNNPGFELVKTESIITVDGYDFRVKQLKQNIFSKSIVGVSTFFDLSKKQRHTELKGVKYITEHLDFLFSATGWTYTISSSLASKRISIPTFGKGNVIALAEKIKKYYECEYIILRDNVVHFAEQVGPDNDFQFRYKNNIGSVVLKEDTTNLYTKITGFGANGVTAVYESPNVVIFGELESDAIYDDRFTIQSNLLDYIKGQIKDVPELVIESAIPELTARDTGERVWLIYEPLNVELQTRIIKQTKILRNHELVTASVIFGNSDIKTVEDIVIEQQQSYTTLNNEAVKQEQLYNGVSISESEGVRVDRSDGTVTVWLNATEGIRITNNSIRKFYVDTNGNVTFDGRLHITKGDGLTTLLEAFLDTYGGRLIINDVDGQLNVKLGSEENYTRHGGLLKLYNDGEANEVVELSAAGGAGLLSLKYSDGSAGASLWGGTLQLFSGNSVFAETTLTPTFGTIGGQYIATQNYVNSAVSGATGDFATRTWVLQRNYASHQYVDNAIAAAIANL